MVNNLRTHFDDAMTSTKITNGTFLINGNILRNRT